MKQNIRWAVLLFLSTMLFSCASPATETVEVVQEEAATRIVEVETAVDESADEMVEEPETEVEEEMEEAAADEVVVEDAMVQAVDGPTYEPAVTVEQAILERSLDQAKGGEDPLLTIIEYGDFQ